MKAVFIVLVTLLCVSTLMAQELEDAAPCVINGVSYASGELTPDPCNRCRCHHGLNVCNRRGCPAFDDAAPCVINGVSYASGELTPDLCNRCRCRNGLNVCNRRGCPTPHDILPS